MISFAQSLDGKKYHLLKIIEPSVIEDNVDILEVIIAYLFEDFKGIIKEIDEFKKRELIELFEKIYKNLRIFNQKKDRFYENEDINNLIDISESTKMIEIISEITIKYLDLVKKDILVLMIDDLDLNPVNQYKVLEKIRKYLIIPNLLILICFKKEQLLEKIEKKFNPPEKYFEKIFPMDRVIELPKNILSSYLDEENISEIFPNFGGDRDLLVKEAFLKLFENKMGEVELSEVEKDLILPVTIRSIINQLIFLKNLPDENNNPNLIKFSELLINSKSFFEKIIVYNTMSKSYLKNENWIEKIEALDKIINGNDSLENRKEALVEKLYLINYLNSNLTDFSKTIFQNFNLIECYYLDGMPVKKDFKIINSYLLEFIIEFLEENNLHEIKNFYKSLFNNGTFNLKNVFEVLKIESEKLIFKDYYKLVQNFKKIRIHSKESLFDILNQIKGELKEHIIVPDTDLNFLNLVNQEELKVELNLYTKFLIGFENEILDRFILISDDSLLSLVKFFKETTHFLNSTVFPHLNTEEDNLSKVIYSIDMLLFFINIKDKNIKKLIREINKIKNKYNKNSKKNEKILEKKKDKIEINKERIEKFELEINDLKIKESVLQKKFMSRSNKITDTLKSNILTSISRYLNSIREFENYIHTLKSQNIEIEIEIKNLEWSSGSGEEEEIIDKFEIFLESLSNELKVSLEFNFFSQEYIEILEKKITKEENNE